MPLRSAYVAGWITVTAVATTVGMGTVAVVRGAVGDPASIVTLSDSDIAGQGRTGIGTSARIGPSGTTGPSDNPSADPGPSGSPSAGSGPGSPSPSPGQHGSSGPGVSQHPAPSSSAHPSTAPTHHGSSGPTVAPTTSPSATPVFRSLASPGGSILAQCTSSVVYVVSASPNQGYRVLIERSGGEEAEVKFQGSTEVAVQIRCVKGVPTQTIETSDY